METVKSFNDRAHLNASLSNVSPFLRTRQFKRVTNKSSDVTAHPVTEHAAINKIHSCLYSQQEKKAFH